MGNGLFKRLCGPCFLPDTDEGHQLGPHGVSAATAGVAALARDLLHFQATSQVPQGLGPFVVSSKKAQANWYNKLLEAWNAARPPPRTPEEAARFIVQTLKRHQKADVEGLLAFYSLPRLHPVDDNSAVPPPAKPQGVKFELNTLPVDAKSVADGDTITVYVDTTDPRESGVVPFEVHEAAIERARARSCRDYQRADALHKIIVDAGYRVIASPNGGDILARKYRIRFRGIDAPESAMPYGKEAREELVKLIQGKPVKLLAYEDDQYGRTVADVYCNGVFVQEHLLKRGLAWHYVAYDQRPQFSKWEQQARAARRGLWASEDPEKPWEWRKERRNGGNH